MSDRESRVDAVLLAIPQAGCWRFILLLAESLPLLALHLKFDAGAFLIQKRLFRCQIKILVSMLPVVLVISQA